MFCSKPHCQKVLNRKSFPVSSQIAEFEGLKEPPPSFGRTAVAYAVLIMQLSVAFLPLYTVHPKSEPLHPTHFTLHPTPYTLHPTPYTLYPIPSTLHPQGCAIASAPFPPIFGDPNAHPAPTLECALIVVDRTMPPGYHEF